MVSSSRQAPDLAHLSIPKDQRTKSGLGCGTIIFLILSLSAIGGGAAYWFVLERPIEVKVAPVRLTDINQSVSVLKASGYVTPRRRATIAAKITGRISELSVDEGMYVEKDQVLAKLDDIEAVDAIKTSEADLEVARASLYELRINLAESQRKLSRLKTLYTNRLSSKEDMETAQTTADGLNAKIRLAEKQIEAAQIRLEASKRNWDNYIIKSPFSGIVVSKDAQIGEIVSPISAGGGFTRTGIATIVDMNSLEIEVDVNESYIARVKTGQQVEATLDAYSEWRIPAHVRTVIPTADRQKATVKVRILFDKLDPKILPDMGVKVSFLESDPGPRDDRRFLIIPQDSIMKENGKTRVFVFKEECIEQRTIKTGVIRGSNIEVKAGLMEGELVVVENTADLKDGQKARRHE